MTGLFRTREAVMHNAQLRCGILTTTAEAESLRQQWLDLLARAERSELMQSPDWLLTWWRVYGPLDGRQLRVGLFHDGDRLVGIAPLVQRRQWYGKVLPFRRLELMGSGEPSEHGVYSNHLGIIAERGLEARVAAAFAQALNERRFGSWDEVVLPMLSGDTVMPSLLVSALRATGVSTELTELAHARYIPLPSTWNDYLQTLSRNVRKKLKRVIRDFDAWSGHTTQLEVIATRADLERGKKILIQLHELRWAGEGVFRSALFTDFHDGLMQSLAEQGCLELLILQGRGDPVAAVYNMVWNNKVYTYQSGRRLDLPKHLSPMRVLDALAIRRAIDQGRREFDLLADDYPYKRELTLRARPLCRVRAAQPSLLEALRRFAQAGMRRLRLVRASLQRGAEQAKPRTEQQS